MKVNSRMYNNFIVKVVNTIEKYNLISNDDKLVLGVSGGPDSLSMLNVLNDIRNDEKSGFHFDIVVVHVNHLIREEAEDDKNFVENFCKKINVPFYFKNVNVKKIAKENKIGTEEAGRIERYKFFDEILKATDSNKIAIAHNKNDNVETMIMNLMRGSGITGLRGIEPKKNQLIRPLIECERYEIENYCKEKNLNPRIDKTNFENDYSRNKVRNIIIPYIKDEFNPNIIETLNRLSNLVSEEDDFLNSITQKVFNEILICRENTQIELDLKKFNIQEKVIKSRLLLYTISELLGTTKNIEKQNIDDIIRLCENNIGNKFLMPNKNLKVLVKDCKIIVEVIKN